MLCVQIWQLRWNSPITWKTMSQSIWIAITNCHRLGALKRKKLRKFVSHISGSLRTMIRVSADLVWWGTVLWFIDKLLFSRCVLTLQKKQENFLKPLYKVINPIYQALYSYPNYLPKPQSWNANMWRNKFCLNLGGKQEFSQ